MDQDKRGGKVKLILTDDDGTLLDSVEVSVDEFEKAKQKPYLAHLLLADLQQGQG